jgi:CheY-like chemotaxis protein
MDVQAYIEKPASPDDLLKKVSAIVDQPYVIVADDDPDILEAVATVLEAHDFQFTLTKDGAECLEQIHKRMPDLLILDLLMPRMDGFAVIRELRSEPTYAKLPIMVLTTVVEDASRRRYELETGHDMAVATYLQKPIAPDELVRITHQLLGKAG